MLNSIFDQLLFQFVSIWGPTCENITYNKEPPENQLSDGSEPIAIEQAAGKDVEGTGSSKEQEEDNLPELVHDENDYTIPETVVKRLRQRGEDPAKWSRRMQAVAPPSEEIIPPVSTIKADGKDQLDQTSPDDGDISPYATVSFKARTPPMTNDSSEEEIELVNKDSRALPLQPSPISAIEDDDNPPFQDSLVGDSSAQHISANHAEQPSMDKDETPPAAKKPPVKKKVSEKIAREQVLRHAYMPKCVITLNTFCIKPIKTCRHYPF